jgi:hypothetical protein
MVADSAGTSDDYDFSLQVVGIRLTVTKAGTGAGAVTSSPPGITCGDDCSEDYPSGTLVTLTATADGSSTFAGWSGACEGAATCVVTMAAARSVTATFNSSTGGGDSGGGGALPLPYLLLLAGVLALSRRRVIG